MWFKVDDGLTDSDKFLELEECGEKELLMSMGLWLIAGVESSKRGKGGEVPTSVKRMVSKKTFNRLRGKLVESGLWDESDTPMGAEFHDWDEYNEPKTKAEQKKKQSSERAKRAAMKRWHGDDDQNENSDPPNSSTIIKETDAQGDAEHMHKHMPSNAPEPEPVNLINDDDVNGFDSIQELQPPPEPTQLARGPDTEHSRCVAAIKSIRATWTRNHEQATGGPLNAVIFHRDAKLIGSIATWVARCVRSDAAARMCAEDLINGYWHHRSTTPRSFDWLVGNEDQMVLAGREIRERENHVAA